MQQDSGRTKFVIENEAMKLPDHLINHQEQLLETIEITMIIQQ
jgi:hypothetical protein